MRASRSTHPNLPLQPPRPHVRVNGLPKNLLDGAAFLDGEELEAFPAVFGQPEGYAGEVSGCCVSSYSTG